MTIFLVLSPSLLVTHPMTSLGMFTTTTELSLNTHRLLRQSSLTLDLYKTYFPDFLKTSHTLFPFILKPTEISKIEFFDLTNHLLSNSDPVTVQTFTLTPCLVFTSKSIQTLILRIIWFFSFTSNPKIRYIRLTPMVFYSYTSVL